MHDEYGDGYGDSMSGIPGDGYGCGFSHLHYGYSCGYSHLHYYGDGENYGFEDGDGSGSHDAPFNDED